MLYPFINYSAGSLLFNLVWLAGLVRVARRHLTPAGFIRIYSLGTLGVGLIYWLLSKYLAGGETDLSGSYLALLTICGALTALAPHETLSAQAQGTGRTPLSAIFMFVFLACVHIDFTLVSARGPKMSSFISTDGISSLGSTVMMSNQQMGLSALGALVPLVPTALLLYLTAHMRLQWWIVLLLLSDLWLIAWVKLVELLLDVHVASRFFLVFVLSEVVALAVGLVYGWVEKLYARHEARLGMA